MPQLLSKEVTENFPMERRTFAKGILISSSGVAGIFTPLLLSPIIERYGWRTGYMILTLISLSISLIIAFIIPSKDKRRPTMTHSSITSASLTSIWRNQTIWILFMSAFCINNLLYGLNSWLPTFLTSHRGITLTQSGVISSLIGAFSLIGAIGGSYVVGKWFRDKDKQVIVTTSILGSILVFLSYFVHQVPFFILFLGLATLLLTISFVTLMAIPLKLFEGAYFAPSYSTISTGGILGGAITQLVIGFLVDSTGTFLTVFIYFLILGLLNSLIVLLLNPSKTKTA